MREMKLLVCCVFLTFLRISPQATAQSLFDGKWKIDLDESQSSTTQYSYLLQSGIYRCSTCNPSIEIKADGKDHKITGEPCYDTVSLKVVDANTTEETDKRNR